MELKVELEVILIVDVQAQVLVGCVYIRWILIMEAVLTITQTYIHYDNKGNNTNKHYNNNNINKA